MSTLEVSFETVDEALHANAATSALVEDLYDSTSLELLAVLLDRLCVARGELQLRGITVI
jgi:hypothetical protein